MPPFNPAHALTYPALIGTDEAGRGAICGPVVVAAVWFDPCTIPAELLAQLDDSKKLKPVTRELLANMIREHCSVAVAAGSAAAIDRRGILVMTLDAMRRAVVRLAIDAPVRADGRQVPPGLSLPCEAVVRGDGSVPQIAAASIIAKTTRDHLMRRLAGRYPAYQWHENKGYGTADHLAALTTHGPTRHHRRSFAPVAGGCEPDPLHSVSSRQRPDH